VNEQPQNPELTLKQRLLEAVKEKGPDSSEAKALFLEWTMSQERIADQAPGPFGRYELALKRAHLFHDAGLIQDARQALEDALTMAAQEFEPEYWDKIRDELERFK